MKYMINSQISAHELLECFDSKKISKLAKVVTFLYYNFVNWYMAYINAIHKNIKKLKICWSLQ